MLPLRSCYISSGGTTTTMTATELVRDVGSGVRRAGYERGGFSFFLFTTDHCTLARLFFVLPPRKWLSFVKNQRVVLSSADDKAFVRMCRAARRYKEGRARRERWMQRIGERCKACF